ncbi:hypothetical protein M378DRAFT_172291 [Amanita muscaria Koide BX008]|uniref:Uncharacterized protein n=1 Tax=Amanita muscaria (strain Koide BX008) TaxID=946122 RepID=A0A0C2WJS7_AMAMK|nr:hypothetical protein M378DRAFT_172291 [Amanita muscaria Koide BX008]
MPVRTRRQRAQAPSHSDLSHPLSSAPTNVSSSNREERHLADGTIVNVTVSATGKGKHWRWVYPEGDSSGNTSAALPVLAPDLAYPTPPPSTNAAHPQHGKLITPASSMQQIIQASIQNAPRKPEKHLPRAEGAPLVQKRPLRAEDTIAWENELKVSSKKRYWPKVGPTGQALGPYGTWLMNDAGEYIVYPVRKSPRVNKVLGNGGMGGN